MKCKVCKEESLEAGIIRGISMGVGIRGAKIIISIWNSEMEEREPIGEIEINYCPYCGERLDK